MVFLPWLVYVTGICHPCSFHEHWANLRIACTWKYLNKSHAISLMKYTLFTDDKGQHSCTWLTVITDCSYLNYDIGIIILSHNADIIQITNW